jgi:hypothetical protein
LKGRFLPALPAQKQKNPAIAEQIGPVVEAGPACPNLLLCPKIKCLPSALPWFLSPDDEDSPCLAVTSREDPVKNALSFLDQRRKANREKTAC